MDLIREIDIFGYQFNLKIEKQNKYKTFVGGLGTLILIGSLIALTYFEFGTLQSQNQVTIMSNEVLLDVNSINPMQLKDLGLLVYVQVSHNGDPSYLNLLSTYFSYYEVNNQNFDTNIKICTRDDFANVQQQDLYDTYQKQNTTQICLGKSSIMGLTNQSKYLQETVNQAIYMGLFQCYNNCTSSEDFNLNSSLFTFTTHYVQRKIDISIKKGMPTRFVDEVFTQFQINPNAYKNEWLVLRKNSIKVKSMLYPLVAAQNYEFFDVDLYRSKSGQQIQQPFLNTGLTHYYSNSLYLSNTQINHSIQYSGILDAFAWIGGWFILLHLTLSFIFTYINEFSFIIYFIQQMLQTRQSQLKNYQNITYKFIRNNQKTRNQQNSIVPEKKTNNQINLRTNEGDFENINFTFFNQIQILTIEIISSIFCCFKFDQNNIYQVYKQGKTFILEETDILQLINFVDYRKNEKKTIDQSVDHSQDVQQYEESEFSKESHNSRSRNVQKHTKIKSDDENSMRDYKTNNGSNNQIINFLALNSTNQVDSQTNNVAAKKHNQNSPKFSSYEQTSQNSIKEKKQQNSKLKQLQSEGFGYKTQNELVESKVSLSKELQKKNYSVDEKQQSDIENIDMLINNFQGQEMLKDLDKIEQALVKKVEKLKQKKVISQKVKATEIDQT